jgi:diguanylate cyclase
MSTAARQPPDPLGDAIHEGPVKDRLTRVSNRQYFSDRVFVEVAVARRIGHDAALLLVDLDGLRRLNHRYGPLVGDRALQVVADHIARVLPEGALFARHGGDTFAIFCSQMDVAAGALLAGRIRRTVAGLCSSVRGERVFMTVTIGVATMRALPPGAETRSSLLALAHGRLSAAKAAGTNRICADDIASGR